MTHEPTDAERDLVRRMVAGRAKLKQVCGEMGISEPTLRKYYGLDIRAGLHDAGPLCATDRTILSELHRHVGRECPRDEDLAAIACVCLVAVNYALRRLEQGGYLVIARPSRGKRIVVSTVPADTGDSQQQQQTDTELMK